MTEETKVGVLLEIFRRVLERPELSSDDNVFEFGCTSMLCLKAVLSAIDAGVPITVFDVYGNRTINGAARAAATRSRGSAGGAAAALAEENPVGQMPTLTPTARFLVDQAGFGEHYNISILWDLAPGQIDLRLLKDAVATLIERHATLRTRLHRDETGLCKTYDGDVPADALEVLDLSASPREAQPDQVERVAARIQREFRFTKDRPLIRFVAFRLSDGRGRLLVVSHHLLLDGIAFSLLFKELGRIYRGLSQRVATRSLVAMTQPSEWPSRLYRYANQEAVDELPFWRAIPWERCGPVALRPADDGSPPQRRATFSDETARKLHHVLQRRAVDDGQEALEDDGLEALEMDQAIVRTWFDGETSRAFLSISGDQGYDVVLLAIHRAMREAASLDELWIDSFHSCRGRVFDDVDNSRTLGYINEICPILLAAGPAGTVEEELAAVRAQRERMPRLGLGFRALKYYSNDEDIRREAAEWSFPRIGLNYIVTLKRSHPEAFLDLEKAAEWFGVEIDESRTPYLACFILSSENEQLVLDTRYDPAEADHAAVRRVASRVAEEITGILGGLDI